METAAAYNGVKSYIQGDYITGSWAGFMTMFTPVVMVVDLKTAEILAVDSMTKQYSPQEIVDLVKQAAIE